VRSEDQGRTRIGLFQIAAFKRFRVSSSQDVLSTVVLSHQRPTKDISTIPRPWVNFFVSLLDLFY